MTVTIWHNPRCSKSRQTLRLLEERGLEPTICLYLQTPPSVAQLRTVLGMLGLSARQLMRTKEAEYKQLGLDDVALDEEALMKAMVATPKLIERPVVIADGRAAIGRPPENVLTIL